VFISNITLLKLNLKTAVLFVTCFDSFWIACNEMY